VTAKKAFTWTQEKAFDWFNSKPGLPDLGKFWSVLQLKVLVCFMATWSIIQTFGIFCGFYGHLVKFSRFGMLYKETSGSPVRNLRRPSWMGETRLRFLIWTTARSAKTGNWINQVDPRYLNGFTGWSAKKVETLISLGSWIQAWLWIEVDFNTWLV
jgi:hypothetical protein